MAESTLTKAETTKLNTVVGKLATSLKIKASDEKGRKNLERYANKWVRFKLGRRGTGPHSHGFDTDQRKAITTALAETFGIKPKAKAAPAKASSKKSGSKRTTSRRRSTSQLAGEQQARAEAAS